MRIANEKKHMILWDLDISNNNQIPHCHLLQENRQWTKIHDHIYKLYAGLSSLDLKITRTNSEMYLESKQTSVVEPFCEKS